MLGKKRDGSHEETAFRKEWALNQKIFSDGDKQRCEEPGGSPRERSRRRESRRVPQNVRKGSALRVLDEMMLLHFVVERARSDP